MTFAFAVVSFRVVWPVMLDMMPFWVMSVMGPNVLAVAVLSVVRTWHISVIYGDGGDELHLDSVASGLQSMEVESSNTKESDRGDLVRMVLPQASSQVQRNENKVTHTG